MVQSFILNKGMLVWGNEVLANKENQCQRNRKSKIIGARSWRHGKSKGGQTYKDKVKER